MDELVTQQIASIRREMKRMDSILDANEVGLMTWMSLFNTQRERLHKVLDGEVVE